MVNFSCYIKKKYKRSTQIPKYSFFFLSKLFDILQKKKNNFFNNKILRNKIKTTRNSLNI